jgi:hypothetical protein
LILTYGEIAVDHIYIHYFSFEVYSNRTYFFEDFGNISSAMPGSIVLVRERYSFGEIRGDQALSRVVDSGGVKGFLIAS